MKRFRLLLLAPVMLLTVAASGPSSCDRSVLEGGSSLTTSIINPAKPINIYQVKLVYEKAVDAVNEYRDLCYPTAPFKAYETLMKDEIIGPICKRRRSIVAKAQDADDIAFAAIAKAEDFIKRNPTVSAVTVIREAWAAVTNFQGVINTSAASVAAVK